PPVDWKLTVGQVILSANHLIALIVAPLMMVGVALFLARSRYGLAIRASAERGDRAAMLGITVGRLNTEVWAIAASMSFVALFMQRSSRSRRDTDAASTWRGAEEVRPLADADRRHPMVRLVFAALVVVGLVVVVGAPFVMDVDYIIKASAIFAFAIIGLS